MGQSISVARNNIRKGDTIAAAKAEQELDVLSTLLKSQLNDFESKLNAKFLNPSSTEKTEVPGIRALRMNRAATVQFKDGPSQDLSSAIDSFLGVGPGVDTGVRSGFKKTVTASLGPFMSNTEVGQHTEQKFFIFTQNNTVIRFDVMLWRWNFGGNGYSTTNIQNAIGYVICTSAVDVTVLETSEFAFLISEYAGDEEDEIRQYTEKMTKIYSEAQKMKMDQIASKRRAAIEDL